MVDIDSSDVVIANLWRESIGTVVGIVQARRKGKPVILIDQNYLDSLVLKTMVGESYIVHSPEAAVSKLREIESQLVRGVRVHKRRGTVEVFELAKLHNSLNALCAKAGIEDAVLPELVGQGVSAAVRSAAAKTGSVKSEEIEHFVFDQLDQLSRETDKLYEEELKSAARRLKDAWEKYQRVKDDNRALEELARQESLQGQNIRRLEAENVYLKSTLRDYELQLEALYAEENRFEDVLSAVTTAKQKFDQDLVFHKRAMQSARDTPYRDPDKVYYALSLLAAYARERRERLLALHPEDVRLPLDVWLKEKNCPFEYAPNESEMTRNNASARKERTLNHEGAAVLLMKHLKVGKGDPNVCCRIYFEIMEADGGRILVGHVGRHLGTVTSR